MPGAILTQAVNVLCAHGGAARPATVASRVTILGAAVAVQPAPDVVSGCPHTTPAGAPQPCLTARWISASARVTALGQPVLLVDSKAIAAETGAPVSVIPAQSRVRGV